MVTRTKKIFVGGLSTTTTLDEVKEYFAKFGEVRVVSDYQIMLYPEYEFRSRMPC
jgi:RNA recognition motif-containing protein